jgi:hypothetical protein
VAAVATVESPEVADQPPAEPAPPPEEPVTPPAEPAPGVSWRMTVLRPWLAAVGAALIVLTVLWLPAREVEGDAVAVELLRCGLLGAAMAAAVVAATSGGGRRAVALAALVGLAAAAAGLLTNPYAEDSDAWFPIMQLALLGAATGSGPGLTLGRAAGVRIALAGLAGGALGGLLALTPDGKDLYWVISGAYYALADEYDPWRTQLGYVKWLWPQLAACAVIALGVVLARRRVARPAHG